MPQESCSKTPVENDDLGSVTEGKCDVTPLTSCATLQNITESFGRVGFWCEGRHTSQLEKAFYQSLELALRTGGICRLCKAWNTLEVSMNHSHTVLQHCSVSQKTTTKSSLLLLFIHAMKAVRTWTMARDWIGISYFCCTLFLFYRVNMCSKYLISFCRIKQNHH